MPRKNASELTHNWHEIADRIGKLSNEVSSMHIDLLLKSDDALPAERDALLKLASRLQEADDALSGLPYSCTPQSEWLGGDQFAIRAPHIIGE